MKKIIPYLVGLLTLTPATNLLAAEQLDEIMVKGEPVFEAEPDLPLGVAVSGDKLKTIPGSSGDPLRGVQSLPGITTNDDTSVAPAIRGSRPGDNEYQVDFIPAGYLFHLSGAISTFNSELVEKFTIYSSAYGPEFSGVTGGIIDVKLRDPKTDRIHGVIDFNFLDGSVLLEGPITENQSFYLAGRMSYLDLLVKDQIGDEDGLEYVQYPKYSDYQGKYRLDMHELGVVKLHFNGADDLREINANSQADWADTEPAFLGRLYSNESYHRQCLDWQLRFGRGHELKSAVAHYSQKSETQSGNAGNSDVKSDTILVKSHLRYLLNENHTIKGGVELYNVQSDYVVEFLDPGNTEFEPRQSYTGADRLSTDQSIDYNRVHLFLQDSWFVGDRLSINGGLVYQGEDYLDKYFLEPRLSAEYDLGNGWLLNGAAGLYHQMPEFNKTDRVFGNPNLDYIKSTQAVVGVLKDLGNGWSWKSDLYYKYLDNLVTGDAAKKYANNGEGYAYGLETLIRKDLTDKLSGWLSLTVSEAKRKHKISGNEFPFDYDQPFNASLVTQYKWSEKMIFGLKYWLHSGSPYTPVIGSVENPNYPDHYNALYGDINSDRMKTFNRLDLRVDRKFVSKTYFKLTGYFECLNVLDTKNVSYYNYNKDYSKRTQVNQLPRIISIGLKIEF